jgi:hypothetical protein
MQYKYVYNFPQKGLCHKIELVKRVFFLRKRIFSRTELKPLLMDILNRLGHDMNIFSVLFYMR